jgi:hypothetical protein
VTRDHSLSLLYLATFLKTITYKTMAVVKSSTLVLWLCLLSESTATQSQIRRRAVSVEHPKEASYLESGVLRRLEQFTENDGAGQLEGMASPASSPSSTDDAEAALDDFDKVEEIIEVEETLIEGTDSSPAMSPTGASGEFIDVDEEEEEEDEDQRKLDEFFGDHTEGFGEQSSPNASPVGAPAGVPEGTVPAAKKDDDDDDVGDAERHLDEDSSPAAAPSTTEVSEAEDAQTEASPAASPNSFKEPGESNDDGYGDEKDDGDDGLQEDVAYNGEGAPEADDFIEESELVEGEEGDERMLQESEIENPVSSPTAQSFDSPVAGEIPQNMGVDDDWEVKMVEEALVDDETLPGENEGR